MLSELPIINGLLAGVDEAGRGPLVGNVVAAAVILNSDDRIEGLADSKKLSARRREQLAIEIRQRSRAWAVVSVSPEEIDQINILQATMLAMKLAVEQLNVTPDHVFVDGNRCPDLSLPVTAIVKGDDRVSEISAASIIAKVTRDEQMQLLHNEFPQYGFDRHKGYPTKAHMAALAEHGPCPQHRRSYAPVRRYLERHLEACL
jgi:ribonuclease HII